MNTWRYNLLRRGAKEYVMLATNPASSRKMKIQGIIDAANFCRELKFMSMVISNKVCMVDPSKEFAIMGHHVKACNVLSYLRRIYKRRVLYEKRKNGPYSFYRWHEKRGFIHPI